MVSDNQYGSPTSYEVITAEEAARTGLKETPSESMDQKAMITCLCLWVLNNLISIFYQYKIKPAYVYAFSYIDYKYFVNS